MGHIAAALKKSRQASAEARCAADSSPLAPGLNNSAGATPIRGLSGPDTPIRSPHDPDSAVDWNVHPSLIAHTQRDSSVAEQYRGVRTWLMSRMKSGRRTTLALTSSTRGEGTTVTTANLAVVLAEIRQLRVLAVDGDLRSGGLASLFGLPESPGLADVLSGDVALNDVLHTTPMGNLLVMPAGTCNGPSAAKLLNTPAAARVFDQIRERFDFCLVDTPPVQSVSDVGVIGSLCAGILMVVRMHSTASHIVQQSLQWLQANHLPVLGCIATACNLNDALYDTSARNNED